MPLKFQILIRRRRLDQQDWLSIQPNLLSNLSFDFLVQQLLAFSFFDIEESGGLIRL